MKRLIVLAGFFTMLLSVAAGCFTRRSEPFAGPVSVKNEAVRNGEQKFMTYCNKCHPAGEAGLGPAINTNPAPRFIQAFQIRHGLGTMPSFTKEEISKQDVRDITKYLKVLRHNK
jgi:mono/diheme cytochrome c family protein